MTLNTKTSIEIAKLIFDKTVNKADILKQLNIKDATFYKHISLLKKAGFKIKIQKEHYKLMSFKSDFEIQEFEKSIFACLMSLACVCLSEKRIKEFMDSIERILYLTNEEIYTGTLEKFNFYKNVLFNEFYCEKIKTIKKHIENNDILRVTLSSKKEMILKPLDFESHKEKVCACFLDTSTNEVKKILMGRIVKLMVYEENYVQKTDENKETVFELYAPLSKTYLLKEDERVLDKSKNKLVVANSSTDKKNLFQRLLRYDILCKVILPKKDVSSFKKLIEKSCRNVNLLKEV